MNRLDQEATIGGALLVLLGLGAIWIAFPDYPMGTLARMGPGFFPVVLGVILTCLGIILLATGLISKSKVSIGFALKGFGVVLAAVAAFTVVIGTFGMIPAVVALLSVVALGDPRVRSLRGLIVGLAAVFVVYLIFGVGLGIRVPAVTWP